MPNYSVVSKQWLWIKRQKLVGCEQKKCKKKKDLRIEAQQRDFQNQLIAEQTAHQQISGILELLWQELEAIKSDQHNQNPMDISSSTDAVSELNRVKQQAEQEKRSNEENLAKLKAEHEQALQNKNCKITKEIERIKQNMEDQMRKERESTAKANEIQMQTIMSELCALKENQVKDTTDRKVGEKVLPDNIKASIDPILKSDFKSGEPIGMGTRLKDCRRRLITTVLQLSTKNAEPLYPQMIHLLTGH